MSATTTTTPDTEIVSLEHLEFTPKCSMTIWIFNWVIRIRQCRRDATWITLLPCGCKHITFCGKHRHADDGVPLKCRNCQQVWWTPYPFNWMRI